MFKTKTIKNSFVLVIDPQRPISNFFGFSFGRFKIIVYFCKVVWPRLCDRHIEMKRCASITY